MLHRFPLALLVCAVVAVGCDSRPYGLAPVSGIIMLDGNPVPGAQVSYQPQGSTTNPGPGSVGVCDDSGRYELKTIRDEPGAIPGPHAVRVYGPKDKANYSSDSDASGAPKELFPRKYNFATELTFTVPEEGTDSANFELISK